MTDDDSLNQFETTPKEFGNGAHVVVPKDWSDDIILLKRVGPQVPPQFHGVAKERFVEAEFEEGEELWISGPVVEVKNDVSDKNMHAHIVLEEDHQDEDVHNLYRIETDREAGDDGWCNGYEIYKFLTPVEIEEADDEIELVELPTGDTMRRVGTLKELSVKSNV